MFRPLHAIFLAFLFTFCTFTATASAQTSDTYFHYDISCSPLLHTPLAYNRSMEFIETPTFTRLIVELLSDDEYHSLQNALLENPQRGDIINDGGGIRKVRHAAQGRGKSGGIRVIYYWIKDDHLIYMLMAYPKSKKDTLTAVETALLRDFVKEL